MTTFQSRKAVRDELVTLFTANGSWESVYGYYPGHSVISGQTPVLVIQSAGTQQTMSGMHTNPTGYRFILASFVLRSSSDDNWTPANAEDKLDELDKELRQVIRDNAALTNADNIEFGSGFSQVNTRILESSPYDIETRDIFVRLAKGSV